jgi:hypothetical protein
MENITVALLAFTNVLIVILLGIFGFFIYRLLKQQNQLKNDSAPPLGPNQQQFHPEIMARLKDAQSVKVRKPELYCPNHPDEPGEVMCAICDRLFCKACIKPFKSLHFCKEHIPLVMRHDWEEVLTVKTSTTDPEHGVRLYDRKKEIFQREDIPTYVETHYKINVDQDYIETYLVLFGIKEHIADLKQKFENL